VKAFIIKVIMLGEKEFQTSTTALVKETGVSRGL
jgi:hypothetical protein